MSVCGELASHLGALFQCRVQGRYTRVRTPFLYPDGDVIDLFVLESGDTQVVSDLGETTRWLRMQTLSPKRSPKQAQLIEDVCLNHGVEFFRGTLTARVRPGENLTAAVIRVAQAALRTADIWFTFRNRAVETIVDEVADFLVERRVDFERSVPIVGRSNRTYRPSFYTRRPQRSSLIWVLSTGSKAAARQVVEHAAVAWYDLNHLRIGPERMNFVSLFDDSMDVWTEEDFRLAGELSTVVQWSEPDALLESIAA